MIPRSPIASMARMVYFTDCLALETVDDPMVIKSVGVSLGR